MCFLAVAKAAALFLYHWEFMMLYLYQCQEEVSDSICKDDRIIIGITENVECS